jgi:iron complex outermembrane receptor protein
LVDLRAVLGSIALGDATGEISLWGRNIFNEDAPLSFIDFGSSFGGLTVAYYPEPRTYGITLGVSF